MGGNYVKCFCIPCQQVNHVRKKNAPLSVEFVCLEVVLFPRWPNVQESKQKATKAVSISLSHTPPPLRIHGGKNYEVHPNSISHAPFENKRKNV